jgi:hypothetical protein
MARDRIARKTRRSAVGGRRSAVERHDVRLAVRQTLSATDRRRRLERRTRP